MLRLGCLLLIVLTVAVPIVTAPHLPWWGTLGVLLIEWGILLLVLPAMAKAGMRGFAERLFGVKSRVLRGASVEVHRCVRVAAPPRRIAPLPEDDQSPFPAPPQPDPAEEPRPHWHVLVDCTITPRPPKGPMQTWDPGDLALCPYEKDVSFRTAAAGGSDPGDEGRSESVRLNQPDTDADAPIKLQGPARLELVFGLPETLRPGQRVKLRYYFEGLGDFRLPG